ncbi:hypothetical protein BDN71DRAFT_1454734 [Pleurotus eryngii]|uniref:Uncharacterized protein n=1 Tax=Pleurotus eryngii TaxID=5323 RepID=A0A9P5ZP84_PLEER|nr:hypothetical protein BDN71DRAFT_1454734 [Pleurotus eryngii]
MGIHPVYNGRLASQYTSYAARATRTFPHTSISYISKDSRTGQKSTKWAADFTHFRARNKLNASKAEREPKETTKQELAGWPNPRCGGSGRLGLVSLSVKGVR